MWVSWTYLANKAPTCIHNKNTIVGYGQKRPRSQNEKETREKNPSNRNFDFKDIYGFTWEKKTAINPKIVVLPPQPLSITKNRFATKNKLVKLWKKTL